MQQAGQQEGIQPIIPQRLSLWKHTQCGVTLKYKTSYIRLNSEHSSGTVARVGIYLIMSCYLWSPYGIGQTIIFLPCVSSIFLFFSSPNLSRRRMDVCHTSTHGVALVQI